MTPGRVASAKVMGDGGALVEAMALSGVMFFAFWACFVQDLSIWSLGLGAEVVEIMARLESLDDGSCFIEVGAASRRLRCATVL